MAAKNLAAIAQGLFEGLMVPLVLGGPVRPGRPIGPGAALSFGFHGEALDPERLSAVQLARVRLARALLPVDRLEPRAPSPAEMAIAAALHDLLQSTHPDLVGVFRRALPGRLLDLVEATLDRIPPPATLREALARHTWFARALEIGRTDTRVSWWTGHREFHGAPPPARLTAWPRVRRVTTDTTVRGVMDLPEAGGAAPPARFAQVLKRWLASTPLTDLATCQRSAPAFEFSPASLALIHGPNGRTLALRALGGEAAVDEALGRATRALLVRPTASPADGRAWPAAATALLLLRERTLERAMARGGEDEPPPKGENAAFAAAAGAALACRALREGGLAIPAEQQRRLLASLEPLAAGNAGRELEALLRLPPATG